MNKKNDLYNYDLNLKKKFSKILGIDECGRGCIAGPLVVAGVILKDNYFNEKIQDSKKIHSLKNRQILCKDIIKNSISYQVEVFNSNFVDKNNPRKTSIIGMEKIANGLKKHCSLIITDYEKINVKEIEQLNLKKGDQTSYSVAAASIIAKSYRDILIYEINKKYPEYDLIHNQGYKTKKHIILLKRYGPKKDLHRFSYNLK